MKNKKKSEIYSFIMIGFLLILLGSCKKDKENAPDPVYPASSLSFDYSGVLNGTFTVVGNTPLSNSVSNIFNHEWANGQRFTDFGRIYILIEANAPTHVAGGSHLQMHIQNPRIGNYSLPSDRASDNFVFGLHTSLDQKNFSFTSGTIIITTFETKRIIGTFSGTLHNLQGGMITITNGKFNMQVSEG